MPIRSRSKGIYAMIWFCLFCIVSIHLSASAQDGNDKETPAGQNLPRIVEVGMDPKDSSLAIEKDKFREGITIPEAYGGKIQINPAVEQEAVLISSKNMQLFVDSGTLYFKDGIPVYGENLHLAQGSQIRLPYLEDQYSEVVGKMDKLALLPDAEILGELGYLAKQVYFAEFSGAISINDRIVSGNDAVVLFGLDIKLFADALTINHNGKPYAAILSSPVGTEDFTVDGGNFQKGPPQLSYIMATKFPMPVYSDERIGSAAFDPVDFSLRAIGPGTEYVMPNEGAQVFERIITGQYPVRSASMENCGPANCLT